MLKNYRRITASYKYHKQNSNLGKKKLKFFLSIFKLNITCIGKKKIVLFECSINKRVTN